jgi:hypothetical protein
VGEGGEGGRVVHRGIVMPEMVSQAAQTVNMQDYVPRREYDELNLNVNALNFNKPFLFFAPYNTPQVPLPGVTSTLNSVFDPCCHTRAASELKRACNAFRTPILVSCAKAPCDNRARLRKMIKLLNIFTLILQFLQSA